jgi:hypothetical protein
MLKVKGISRDEKKIIVFSKDQNKIIAYTADEGYGELTKEQYTDIHCKPITSEWQLVPFDEKVCKTHEEYYNYFIDQATKIRDGTKGIINPFKCGKPTKCALKFLYDGLNKKKIFPEDLRPHELDFIGESGGAFRLGLPYVGDVYKYDARSYYPSVYSSKFLLIPIKAGILKNITTEELNERTYFDIGVYYCTIEQPQDANIKKLIWINHANYYSHYELQYAKDKGLKITMLSKDGGNFLHYPRNHCKTGSEIFGDYAKTLYKLKESGIHMAKLLLNSIWGILIQKSIVKIGHIRGQPFDLKEGNEIVKMEIVTDTYRIFHVQKINVYEHAFARMRPFFLAKCRITMAKHIEPFINDVYYSHTDSIVSCKPLPFEDDGKLGSFKFEGHFKNTEIKNANSVKYGKLCKK